MITAFNRAVSEGMRPFVNIRSARAGELGELQEIERRAAHMFRPFGCAELYARSLTGLEALRQGRAQRRLFVAADARDRPIGFALTEPSGRSAWLAEVDVLPSRTGRGVGTSLVRCSIEWACEAGVDRLLLSTMRRPRWNAPFYARFGFREVPAAQWGPELRAARGQEARRGFPMDERLIMQLDLTGIHRVGTFKRRS